MKFQHPSMHDSKDIACIKKRDGKSNIEKYCHYHKQLRTHNLTQFEPIYCFCDIDLDHKWII